MAVRYERLSTQQALGGQEFRLEHMRGPAGQMGMLASPSAERQRMWYHPGAVPLPPRRSQGDCVTDAAVQIVFPVPALPCSIQNAGSAAQQNMYRTSPPAAPGTHSTRC